MGQTTFTVDADTIKAIAELKASFGATTNAQVIRKALSLARIAARTADDTGAITLVDKDQNVTKLLINA